MDEGDENNVHNLEIHKVGIPAPKGFLDELKANVMETLFPDDPFRQFRKQTLGRQWRLCLQYFFPILQWGPNYSFGFLKADVVSGLTIASLAIPQGISYAKLASLPPILGLYSSFVPPLIYAIFGGSKDLAVGTVSIASLLLGAMLREEVSPIKEPALYLQLAFTATFFAGLFQASMGILRFGFIIDFLSHATIVGFMAGSAVIVSLQQLKGLLGISHFTKKMDVISVLHSVLKLTEEWTWQTVVMGLSFLALLLTARYISMRHPKLFWVSATAPLICVVVATILSYATGAEKHHINIIGHLEKGLNSPSMDLLYFHGPYLATAVKAGLVTGLISLSEGIVVGRTFASLKDYQVDGNKEMMAIGLMNISGSLTSCYVTTGSFSRSAINNSAGCMTIFSNVIMAGTIMMTLLFLTPLFYHTPSVVLSSIIITAVVSLIDLHSAYSIWKVDKIDFIACSGAFVGVIFISVQMGLLIAVGISIGNMLLHVIRPHILVLGNVPGTASYRNMGQYKEALRVPGFLIISIDSPIYFANSTYLRERILHWVKDEDDRIEQENATSLQNIIVDMTAVTTIDINGVSMIMEIMKALKKQGFQVALANPSSGVMEKLHRANVIQCLGQDCLYISVGEAITSCSSHIKHISRSTIV